MPTAEIITIGTEILLGEIVDTNAPYIARGLRDLNIDLYRKTSVGDNVGRIAQAIQEALTRSEIIITTGGLGPTVDDPTREAVARAVGVETEYHPELWEQIQARFKRYGRLPTENNKRQAYIPQGAIPIENPVGTAPCFIVEQGQQAIISLPGVPREMEYLLKHAVLPYLRQHYQLKGLIKARLIHTAGVGESQIDDLIGDLEQLTNPSVGLAAHSGQVDVRITVKADSESEAAQRLDELEAELRRRLGSWIYGVDLATLEEVALAHLREKGWTLAVVEAGLNGELVRRLASGEQALRQLLQAQAVSNPGADEAGTFLGGEMLTTLPDSAHLLASVSAFRASRSATVGLGVAIHPAGERQDVALVVVSPTGEQQLSRPYGGAPEYAPRWSVNHSLDLLRNL